MAYVGLSKRVISALYGMAGRIESLVLGTRGCKHLGLIFVVADPKMTPQLVTPRELDCMTHTLPLEVAVAPRTDKWVNATR